MSLKITSQHYKNGITKKNGSSVVVSYDNNLIEVVPFFDSPIPLANQRFSCDESKSFDFALQIALYLIDLDVTTRVSPSLFWYVNGISLA